MASSHMTIDFTRWPEALAMIRREVARALREEAEAASDPRVAVALCDVALRFEIGLTQRDEPDRGAADLGAPATR